MAPYFSIITVAYNAETSIKSTIDSVLMQCFNDYEVIIKDGKSQDKTMLSIPDDKRIVVFSEKDQGIYDAMNYAIARAKGKYLVFMNCGDLFADDKVLGRMKQEIESLGCADIVYGDFEIDGIVYNQTNTMSDFYLYRTPLNHQSMFISKRAFDLVGVYNCNYKILADFDFTVRCWKRGLKFQHIDITVCKYLGGGVSESKQGMTLKETERRIILKKYFSKTKRLLYDFILIVSLRRLRIWMFSGNCPNFVRKLYRKIVNFINRKS